METWWSDWEEDSASRHLPQSVKNKQTQHTVVKEGRQKQSRLKNQSTMSCSCLKSDVHVLSNHADVVDGARGCFSFLHDDMFFLYVSLPKWIQDQDKGRGSLKLVKEEKKNLFPSLLKCDVSYDGQWSEFGKISINPWCKNAQFKLLAVILPPYVLIHLWIAYALATKCAYIC